MCNLTKKIKSKSMKGYKIVAEKDGKNYSLAMGFCYEKLERIPKVNVQKRITRFFAPQILESPLTGYVEDMVGRTAIFTRKKDAVEFFDSFTKYLKSYNYFDFPFKFALKRAVVSEDLMSGSYGISRVVAGRKIEILETISCFTPEYLELLK